MAKRDLMTGQPLMWDAPQDLPWYRQPGYRPTNFLMDAAAKFVGQPLADAYTGLMQAGGFQQDPNAAQGYVSQEALNKGAQGIAGGQLGGSMFAKAPAGALRSGLSGVEKVYHGGPIPKGARFDPSKSNYDGDVFLGVNKQTAKDFSGWKGGDVHSLEVDPKLNIWDHRNPKHVDDAMKWWKSKNPTASADDVDAMRGALKEGSYHQIEPSPRDSGFNVNEYIRENFDGYRMLESWDSPSIGIHKPNSVFWDNGDVFYSNPVGSTVLPERSKRQKGLLDF